MLCEHCTAVIQNPKFSRVSSLAIANSKHADLDTLHSGFSSLEAALNAGCGICRRLLNALVLKPGHSQIFSHFELKPDIERDSFLLQYRFTYETKERSVISLFALFRAKKKGAWLEEHCFESLFLSPEQIPLPNTALVEASNGIDTKSMNVISFWIENCQNNHEVCRREHAPIPKHRFARILDVESLSDSQDIKLCTPDQLPAAIKYMTLSHCWGGDASAIPCLTKNRYSEYFQNISFATLPKTFQDTVLLARRLAIQYIWIDSLCIVQDSKDDWLAQAAIMGEVYRGAFLNVAATKSDHPNGGLFTTRDTVLNSPLRIYLSLGPSTEELEEMQWSKSSAKFEGVLEFKLEGFHMLIIIASLPDNKVNEFCVDLGECLGNDDGSFDPEGENFGLTARNITLDGTSLQAELRTIQGDWTSSSIDVSTLLHDPRFASRIRLRRIECTRTNAFYDVGSNYYNMWAREVVKAKLCLRGWVMQERLLAPRVVHFAGKQLFWECVKARAVEERHELEIDSQQPVARSTRLDFKSWDVFSRELVQVPQPKFLGRHYLWSSLKAMYGRDKLPLRKEDLDQYQNLLRAQRMCYGKNEWIPTHPLIKYWSVVATTYNSTKLTYVEDRLIAIAGLARILSERTGVRYVAGLWMYQIPRQLLWFNSFGNLKPNEHEKYVAPSWSWATSQSHLGQRGVTLEKDLEMKGAMDLVKVLYVDIQGVVEDDRMPFGQVKSGRLRIRGRLLPISLDMNVWPQGVSRPKELVQFWAGTTTEAPAGEVFLVPVLFVQWNKTLPHSTPNSLLLESTAQRGTYRRVGVARLSNLCSLRGVVPQLYTAQHIHHEDDTDAEENSSGEDVGLDPIFPASQAVRPSPHQQFADMMINSFVSPRIRRQMNIAEKRMEVDAAERSHDAVSQKKVHASRRALKFFHSVTNGISSSLPYEQSNFANVDPRSLQQELPSDNGVQSGSATKISMQRRKELPMLEPKEALGGHYYLDYVDDDEAVTFGHFVFEII